MNAPSRRLTILYSCHSRIIAGGWNSFHILLKDNNQNKKSDLFDSKMIEMKKTELNDVTRFFELLNAQTRKWFSEKKRGVLGMPHEFVRSLSVVPRIRFFLTFSRNEIFRWKNERIPNPLNFGYEIRLIKYRLHSITLKPLPENNLTDTWTEIFLRKNYKKFHFYVFLVPSSRPRWLTTVEIYSGTLSSQNLLWHTRCVPHLSFLFNVTLTRVFEIPWWKIFQL